jgi:prepilin-type N-terminal cleavage/methylation domain-containing protein
MPNIKIIEKRNKAKVITNPPQKPKIFFINKLEKGFTLVEILAVLSLIAILGGIMISSDYRSVQTRNSLLTDAEAVGQELRDMQNRTTSFVEVEGVSNVGYGVYFDLLNPVKVQSFYKMNANEFGSDEVPGSSAANPAEDLIFNVGDRINRICLNGNCSNTTSKLAIYYMKPRPYTHFARSDDGISYSDKLANSGEIINHACIEIVPSSGVDIRRVDVYYIGQISFSYGACE